MSAGWVFGFFLGVLGIISHFSYIRFASEYNYGLLVIGFFLVCVNTRRY